MVTPTLTIDLPITNLTIGVVLHLQRRLYYCRSKISSLAYNVM